MFPVCILLSELHGAKVTLSRYGLVRNPRSVFQISVDVVVPFRCQVNVAWWQSFPAAKGVETDGVVYVPLSRADHPAKNGKQQSDNTARQLPRISCSVDWNQWIIHVLDASGMLSANTRLRFSFSSLVSLNTPNTHSAINGSACRRFQNGC